MPLFTINAADIDAAGRSLEADLPVAWLDAQLGEASLKGAAPGHLSARLSRSAGDVVVRGKVRASLVTACARCLEQAKIDVDTELSLLLRPDPSLLAEEKAAKIAARAAAAGGKTEAPKHVEKVAAKAAAGGGKGGKGGKRAAKEKEGPEYEFSSEEADFDAYDGETVVLDDFVREAILLEMPIFPLCSESCPGIRPASPDVADGRGEAPPIDPRLAPLGALRAGLAKSAKDAPRPSGSNDDQGPAANGADAPHEKKTKKE
jgi:uncharacterized protein